LLSGSSGVYETSCHSSLSNLRIEKSEHNKDCVWRACLGLLHRRVTTGTLIFAAKFTSAS